MDSKNIHMYKKGVACSKIYFTGSKNEDGQEREESTRLNSGVG
jgi:hypothetical protein